MLKTLIRKQFTEMFRNYFYDQKKNRARSKAASVGLIVMFVFLMFGVMGGIFGFLAYNLVPLFSIGYGWLYFAILGGIGLVYGVIGSVFNTYSGLYVAKDNDLLLSMPIPPRTIVAARTAGVYLMALLYSASVTLPAAVVYFVLVPQTALSVVGAILMIFIVSAIDFVLACLLGWVVAKIASKLKNRSFAVVILSLLFFAVYYFVYFKAQDAIKDLLANASQYGDAIRGSAYPVYLFGRAGEGDAAAMGIFFAVSAALVALSVYVLSHTFIKIVTSSQGNDVKGKMKNIKEKSLFGTLLSKEYARFKSSPTYMLNCSLSTLFLPAAGIAVLIKGADLKNVLDLVFTPFGGDLPVAVCCVVCLITGMNVITTPAISLEGKTLWIEKSLPVNAKSPLLAKLALHVILTTPATALCSVCMAIGLGISFADGVLVTAVSAAFSVMTAAFGLVIGIQKPMLDWTKEIVPIKQNMSILISMLFGTAAVLVLGAVYFIAASAMPAALYLSIFFALFAAASAYLIYWILTKGAEKFSRL